MKPVLPARMPHFCGERAAREAGEPALDDEGAHARGVALLLLGLIRPGEHQHVIGDVGQRDPHLLAGEDVAVALLHRHGLDATGIAAGRGLGEAEGGDALALRLRHEIARLLIVGAPAEESQRVEADVDGQDDAQRRVHVLELFAGQAEGQVVHARAAVLRRHREAEQPQRGHLRQEAAVERVRAIEVADTRGHLAAGPFAHRLLDQAVFVGELEVHQMSAGAASSGLRRSISRMWLCQQELLGDAQRLEHPLDVAVLERPLFAARGRIRPVLQRGLIDHDVLGVHRRDRLFRLVRVEEREHARLRASGCGRSGWRAPPRHACRDSRTDPSTARRPRWRLPARSASRSAREARRRSCPSLRDRCPWTGPRR